MALNPQGHDAAAERCRTLSVQTSWSAAVGDAWPVVVAHEYRRLQAELANGAVVPALMQLKDLAEVLVKLPTITAGRLLVEHGTARQQTLARALLLSTRPPSLDDWRIRGGRLAGEAMSGAAAEPFRPVLALLRDPVTRDPSALDVVLRDIVAWRNRELGHGALRLDLTGYMADFELLLRRLHLALLPHAEPVANIRFATLGGAHTLNGADALNDTSRLSDLVPAGTWSPLVLCSPQGDKLSLGPYVYLHRGAAGREVGCYLINKRVGRKREYSRLHLLDYRNGEHAVAARGHGEPSLVAELEALAREEAGEAEGPQGAVHGISDGEVQDFLDSISVSREFLSPLHFRQALQRFIGAPEAPARPSGMFHLSAPADVGKSTFAYSLATLGHAHRIAKGLGAQRLWDDLEVLVFAIRREYRSSWASLEAHVFAELGRRNNESSLALSGFLSDPAYRDRPGLAFGAWLSRIRVESAGRHGRLLLVLDALDELPTGPARNAQADLLDVLPRPDELPQGVFMLLTSRGRRGAVPAEDANPGPVQEALDRLTEGADPARFEQLDLDPSDAASDYRQVLHDYFTLRTRDVLTDGVLRESAFESLLDRGQHRFRQLAYYSALVASGVLRPEQLESLGPDLLRGHLEALQVHEGKRFGPIRRILLELAAAEVAHRAEVHAQEPAPVVPREWLGLDMLTMASRCGEPGEHAGDLSPRFLTALYSISELLRTYRGDMAASSRFALGIKGMTEELQQLGNWSLTSTLEQALHSAAADCLAAPDEDSRMRAFLQLAGPALALLDHGSQGGLDTDLVRALDEKASILADRATNSTFDFTAGIRLCTAGEAMWRLTSSAIDEPSSVARRASWLRRRGAFRRLSFHFDSACIDQGQAIELLSDLRARQGSAFSAESCDELAAGHVNRGIALRQRGQFAEAIEDFGLAIAYREGLRQKLGDAWSPDLCEHLASAYMNRGVSHRKSGKLIQAIADHGQAIDLRERLRTTLGSDVPRGVLHELAAAYNNRGVAHRALDSWEAAIQDYSRAIALRESLRSDMGPNWPPTWANDLASTYLNRGILHRRSKAHTLALADCDRAIELRERLRNWPGASWTARHKSQLAAAYAARGNVLTMRRTAPRAIEDLTMAIDLRESVRTELSDRWPEKNCRQLADSYISRADAHALLRIPARAAADYRLALVLLEAMPGGGSDALSRRVVAKLARLERSPIQ